MWLWRTDPHCPMIPWFAYFIVLPNNRNCLGKGSGWISELPHVASRCLLSLLLAASLVPPGSQRSDAHLRYLNLDAEDSFSRHGTNASKKIEKANAENNKNKEMNSNWDAIFAFWDLWLCWDSPLNVVIDILTHWHVQQRHSTSIARHALRKCWFLQGQLVSTCARIIGSCDFLKNLAKISPLIFHGVHSSRFQVKSQPFCHWIAPKSRCFPIPDPPFLLHGFTVLMIPFICLRVDNKYQDKSPNLNPSWKWWNHRGNHWEIMGSHLFLKVIYYIKLLGQVSMLFIYVVIYVMSSAPMGPAQAVLFAGGTLEPRELQPLAAPGALRSFQGKHARPWDVESIYIRHIQNATNILYVPIWVYICR